MSRRFLLTAVLALCAPLCHAQSVSVENPECLPVERNAVVRALVESVAPGGSVRLYFRRLHPAGAFYYSRMTPATGSAGSAGSEAGSDRPGAWWAALPKPEDRGQQLLTDEWWEILRTRDWIVLYGDRDREWLERWLEEREQEAAEVYAAIFDARGELVERSETKLVDVTDPDRCPVELDPIENGAARNLTVGETTERQNRRGLFHWLCDGIVTRVNAAGILEADESCRPCVVASASPRPWNTAATESTRNPANELRGPTR